MVVTDETPGVAGEGDDTDFGSIFMVATTVPVEYTGAVPAPRNFKVKDSPEPQDESGQAPYEIASGIRVEKSEAIRVLRFMGNLERKVFEKDNL